jgi:hypothetical protein
MLEFIVTNAQQKVYFVLELVFIMFEILENWNYLTSFFKVNKHINNWQEVPNMSCRYGS